MEYRQADARGESCGDCKHGGFMGSSSTGVCEIVAGKIEVTMVCDRFEPEVDHEKPAEGGGGKPPFPPKKSTTSPSDDGNPFGS